MFEEGLSDKSENDRTELGRTSVRKTLKQKYRFSSSFTKFKRDFKPYEFVKPCRGWIPYTFDHIDSGEQFSFVHIDVDLYEPIKEALSFFYPRMRKGSIIVVDDYGSALFPGAKKAVQEFLSQNSHEYFIENNVGGCLIII